MATPTITRSWPTTPSTPPGGTASKGGPGTFALTFTHPGTFVYYCRFHSHLDAANQPVAPGPKGGIQDANGNFGTPMMGIVTVRG